MNLLGARDNDIDLGEPFRKLYFHASGKFGCLLLTSVNSLDPDQSRYFGQSDSVPERIFLRS